LGEGFNVIASDAMAMLQVTDQYVELVDKEIVIVTKDEVTIETLEGEVISREAYTAELDASDIEKGTYPHYMLKEIDEQPVAIRKIIQEYQGKDGKLTIDPAIVEAVKAADRLYIVAAGTSYHAGLLGKQFIEKLAKIPVEVHV
ncbi:glutamine--fructose-6-phosphate aminotransferase, partial [Bacillus paranthracis]|nr:glutamine--fructose-6-phosphate aminotransferase [Bacillus paranthracis]